MCFIFIDSNLNLFLFISLVSSTFQIQFDSHNISTISRFMNMCSGLCYESCGVACCVFETASSKLGT
jgi:hypothetical protein